MSLGFTIHFNTESLLDGDNGGAFFGAHALSDPWFSILEHEFHSMDGDPGTWQRLRLGLDQLSRGLRHGLPPYIVERTIFGIFRVC